MKKQCGPKKDKIKEELRRSHNEKCHDHTPRRVILKMDIPEIGIWGGGVGGVDWFDLGQDRTSHNIHLTK